MKCSYCGRYTHVSDDCRIRPGWRPKQKINTAEAKTKKLEEIVHLLERYGRVHEMPSL